MSFFEICGVGENPAIEANGEALDTSKGVWS